MMMQMNLGHSYTDPPITVACNRAEGLLCDKVHVRTAATLICHVLMLPNCYIRLIYIVDGLPSIYRGLTVGSGRLLSAALFVPHSRLALYDYHLASGLLCNNEYF